MKKVIFVLIFSVLICFVIFLFRQNKILLDTNDALQNFCDNNIGATTEQEYRNLEIKSEGNILADVKLIDQGKNIIQISKLLKEKTLFFVFSNTIILKVSYMYIRI